MTSVKLMLNKCRMHKDGTYPLVMQIIHSRHKKLVYLAINLKPEEFDEKKGRICHRSGSRFTNAAKERMNQSLELSLKKMEDLIDTLNSEGISYSVEDLVAHFLKKPVQFNLINFIDKQIKLKKELEKEGIAAAYKSTRNSLQMFINRADVAMENIDSHFVTNYKHFLLERKLSDNTICFYMRNFRTIYNLALSEGLSVNKDFPFKNIRTAPRKTVKRALTLKQIQAIANLQLSAYPELECARDYYMFSFYAQGMSFVDIVFLKKKCIVDGVIWYTRHKSNQLVRIKISDRIIELMEKYPSDSNYVFPLIDVNLPNTLYSQYRKELAKINRNLKKIASMVGVSTPLTTYTARHTWATLAHECGASISLISQGMGHTTEEMTRVYLKQFDMSMLDKVNTMVLNML